MIECGNGPCVIMGNILMWTCGGKCVFGLLFFGSHMFGIPHGRKSLHIITRYHYIDAKLFGHLSVEVSTQLG